MIMWTNVSGTSRLSLPTSTVTFRHLLVATTWRSSNPGLALASWRSLSIVWHISSLYWTSSLHPMLSGTTMALVTMMHQRASKQEEPPCVEGPSIAIVYLLTYSLTLLPSFSRLLQIKLEIPELAEWQKNCDVYITQ